MDDLWEDYLFDYGFNNRFMPEQDVSIIYHYTSPDGFKNILMGQKEGISLWASSHDCLNDTSEGKLVEEVYQQVCLELRQEGTVNDAVYEELRKVKPSSQRTS